MDLLLRDRAHLVVGGSAAIGPAAGALINIDGGTNF
jgi:hypothetical protein